MGVIERDARDVQPELDLRHDIVPVHLAVQAMRDSGYKNAAYAIAELMDNSIQAGATQVELLCGEMTDIVQERRRSRIHRIAVLDNGSGMDEKVLRMALQFGNGTRLTREAQKGIGKFGMGLPNSSISQATRLDVWTWQEGPESSIHTYLDLEEIKGRQMHEVPAPAPKEIPQVWRQVGEEFGRSGTLVVWSHLDRVTWKTARSILDHSELLIGRMYRKFLDGSKVRIRLCSFDMERAKATLDERDAVPNDPLYLMSGTSCPAPFDEKPMFELWGEPYEMPVHFRGEVHQVRVTFSMAKEETRAKPNAGIEPHGKHAKKNVGVSIVRADRELDLDQSWVVQYDPRERWWGVEVEFSPVLDDVFGVSNNKQAARNFHKIDEETLLLDGETPAQLRERLKEEGDPIGALLDLSHMIENNLSAMRRLIEAQRKGDRRIQRERHGGSDAEQIATKQTVRRKEEGYEGESDRDEGLPPEQRMQQIEEELTRIGLSTYTAHRIGLELDLKYALVEASLESAAFFSVTPKAGKVIITLNTSHPAYPTLVEVLEEDTEGVDADKLRARLENARNGLRLLLMAWARYEDELIGSRRNQAQDARVDWGRIARQFMEIED
jgi:hypothetical protein